MKATPDRSIVAEPVAVRISCPIVSRSVETVAMSISPTARNTYPPWSSRAMATARGTSCGRDRGSGPIGASSFSGSTTCPGSLMMR
jgi:hypothetical protein